MNPINEVQDIWAYLRTTPLLWLMLTMMAYLLGFWCFEKDACFSMLNNLSFLNKNYIVSNSFSLINIMRNKDNFYTGITSIFEDLFNKMN